MTYSTILYGEVRPIKSIAGFLISRIKQLGGRIFDQRLKESGIDAFNGPQGRILYVLWEHPALTITEIGRMTSLAKTTLTGMLDRMEESGLVLRVRVPHNRRQVRVSLTVKAQGLREDYERVSQAMNEIYYRGMDEDEVKQLEALLTKVLKNLEQYERR